MKTTIPENFPATRPNLYDQPIAVKQIYEYNERGFYRLTPGGNTLNQVRNSLQAGNKVTLSASLTRDDWYKTMAAATERERKELLRLKANNRISIVR